MRQKLKDSVSEAVRAIQALEKEESLRFIEKSALKIEECFAKGGKLLIAGNGGSLCDAMHFAEEITGVFRKKRRALPAIALSCPGHLTCVANDLSFEEVFARGVEAFGRPEDILVVLTTSGNSANVAKAFKAARSIGLGTIAFLGKTGGRLKGICDLELVVEGFSFSDRVQEVHMAAIHIIIEMVEQKLFYENASESPCSSCSLMS